MGEANHLAQVLKRGLVVVVHVIRIRVLFPLQLLKDHPQ